MPDMESLGDILRRLMNQQRREPVEGGPLPEEPKAPACTICGDAGWVTRNVSVGHPDFGEAFPCRCQVDKLRKDVNVLRRYSNLLGLERISLANTQPQGLRGGSADPGRFAEAFEAAVRFAEKPSGWLVFTGPSGSGKTHLAVGVANRCIENGQTVYYIMAADLLDHLRSTHAPDSDVAYDTLFEQVRNVPLLILDDLTARTTTPWAEEKMFQIINHRFNAALPTVITVQGPMDHLSDTLVTRLQGLNGVSRVLSLADHGSRLARELGAQPLANLGAMTLQSFDVNAGQTPLQREALIKAHQSARQFASGDGPAHWLLLSGPRGCGKTHLAAGIEMEWVRQGRESFHAFVPSLMDHLRKTYAPNSTITYDELFDHVKSVPLLVLDDLGTESQTAWTDEKLYQLIVHRYDHRLPTVITTVFTLEDLEEMNPRVASRLVDGNLVNYQILLGPNYRTFPRSGGGRSATS